MGMSNVWLAGLIPVFIVMSRKGFIRLIGVAMSMPRLVAMYDMRVRLRCANRTYALQKL